MQKCFSVLAQKYIFSELYEFVFIKAEHCGTRNKSLGNITCMFLVLKMAKEIYVTQTNFI